MLYIVMALYAEAVPLIEVMQLKRMKNAGLYETFQDEKQETMLVLTGVGKVPAAVTVSHICTKYALGREDFLLHIGCCAGEHVGRLYAINGIEESETARCYYPDMLFRHHLPESRVVTVGKSLEEGLPEKAVLYDMEAAGVYQACVRYLGQHQMAFLKIVSDAGKGQDMTPQRLQEIVAGRLSEILQFVEGLRGYMGSWKRNEPDAQEVQWRQRLYEAMHCSETMRLQAEQLFRYLWLAGREYHEVVEQDYSDGKLPCKDRREGKRYLEKLKERVL